MRHLARFLFVIVMASLASEGWSQQPEMRAVWLTRFEWPSSNAATAKSRIDNFMTTIAANNFNTVLFQVRGQCDVHYPSPYEPWSDTYGWTDPGWDPLAYAIQSAHAQGLELHAYINTHTISQPIPPPVTSPQHMYNLHGPNVPIEQSWLIRDIDGNTGTIEGYRWISPGIPEASAWTRQAVLHVVKNYNVDGVHFDRIRTPGAQYSYDAITVARFNGDGNPDNLAWGDFMRSQITRDLRNIYGEIMLYKPNVKVSAAPFGIVRKDATTHYQGTGTQSHFSWYQDSWGWMSAHVVDFMVPQIYWNIASAHPFELLLADWMEHTGGRQVVAGSTTSGGTETLDNLLAEQQETRNQGAAGHCIFSYSSMTNYWTGFRSGPYTQKVATPGMAWKSNPTTGYIVGYVKDDDGNPVVDAKVKLAGDSYNYLTGYDGFFAILDVPVGSAHHVTASKNGLGVTQVSNISATAGVATLVNVKFGGFAGLVVR